VSVGGACRVRRCHSRLQSIFLHRWSGSRERSRTTREASRDATERVSAFR
jgi:hypothetical protein